MWVQQNTGKIRPNYLGHSLAHSEEPLKSVWYDLLR